MEANIKQCAERYTGPEHCQPTCKGWGCRFLGTPIDTIPETDKEKAMLFSEVYREAKRKGVLLCPHYRSLFIDEVLNNTTDNK